jgi:hypothetical protein
LPLDVILLVLFGALLHATWNAIVKAGSDKSLDAALISAGGAVSALPFLAFLPLPHASAWPFIGASAILQFAYFQLVAAAYRAGDIGLVYPLMRGCAPLLIAATSVLTLALEARRGSSRAVMLSLANACVIASYTYVDGIGARISGNAVSYTLWMSLLPPVLLFSWAVSQRGTVAVVRHVRRNWWRGLIGGAGSIASYGLALWAMTKAPVATVAALRETAILFQGKSQHLALRRRRRHRHRRADFETGVVTRPSSPACACRGRHRSLPEHPASACSRPSPWRYNHMPPPLAVRAAG